MDSFSHSDLHVAVAQIAEIRTRLAHAETYRGYRAATVGATAAMAFVGAGLQAAWCPEPRADMNVYLAIWVSIAVASLVTSIGQALWRVWTTGSSWTAQQTWIALEQFLPCTLLGGAATWAIADWQPDALWLLPGVWSGCFGLGVLASSRQLPRPVVWVGAHYLLCAAVAWLAGPNHWACSPLWMLASFGVGQASLAVILYVYLERPADGEAAEPGALIP